MAESPTQQPQDEALTKLAQDYGLTSKDSDLVIYYFGKEGYEGYLNEGQRKINFVLELAKQAVARDEASHQPSEDGSGLNQNLSSKESAANSKSIESAGDSSLNK